MIILGSTALSFALIVIINCEIKTIALYKSWTRFGFTDKEIMNIISSIMTYIKIIAAANCLRLPSVPDGSIFDKTFEIDTSIARQKNWKIDTKY